jgi:iron(III) transport system substrate-binding protein
MTEDEAVDLFRQAAQNATIVDGHTTMAELLAAGEYDITTSTYQHEILQLQDDGASVAWEPPPQPLILRPNGIGIHSDTDVPASALLFLEYGITEAQSSIAAIHRMPANTNYGDLEAMVNKYDVITTDLVHLDATRAKWEKLYEQVVSESSKDVIEGD